MNYNFEKYSNEYTSKIEANLADKKFREMVDTVALELMEIPAEDYYKDGQLRYVVMLKCHVILEQIKKEQS